MPPVPYLDRVLHALNADSNLQFRPVPKGAQVPYRTKEAAESMANNLAGGRDQYDVVSYSDFAEKGWVILEKAALVTSHEIRGATATETAGHYGVNLSLTADAGRRFAHWTGEHVGDYLAIVLNNEVKSVPKIQNQIQDRVEITGAFTRQMAEDLALVMRSGPLPRRLIYVSEQVITSNRWTRKYGILTGVFAVALVILVGLCYRLVRARPSRKSNQNRLPE
jgi:SecD/SecF fusion protein